MENYQSLPFNSCAHVTVNARSPEPLQWELGEVGCLPRPYQKRGIEPHSPLCNTALSYELQLAQSLSLHPTGVEITIKS